MAQLIVSLLSGTLFGVGLIVSGMVNPQKVLGFLDIAGKWDPTLAFVMGGALLVAYPAFHIVLRRPRPLLGESFYLPAKQQIDSALLFGACVFGIGWGLAGLCPGPALTAIGAGQSQAFVFVGAMIGGVFAHKFLFERRAPSDF